MRMPTLASIELNLIVWSVALCVLQMLISAILTHSQVGFATMIGNREDFPILKGAPGRARRAHENMVANLVLFASLMLVVALTGKSSAMTTLGAELFFWARLVYAIVYLLGIIWARTIVWAISMVGLFIIFIEVI
jgi:uncharacterized MAPEG superfamily protein